jgi:hypothetical protein
MAGNVSVSRDLARKVENATQVDTLDDGDEVLIYTTTDRGKPDLRRAPPSAVGTAALALKANLASPTFTGVPAAPTAAADTSTTQLATTAFVTTADALKASITGLAAGTVPVDASAVSLAASGGKIARTVPDLIEQSIPIMRYVTTYDGSQNERTAIQAAVTAAEGEGKALYIPAGAIIRADTDVTAGTGPLHIFGGGKLLVPPDADGFLDFDPAMGTARTVTAQSNVAYPYSGQLSTRLTVPTGYADFVAGSVIYVHSLQPQAYDATTDKAEIMTVLAVDSGSTYVYLRGLLAEDYLPGTYTMTIRTMSDYHLRIDDILFEGQEDLDDDSQALRSTLAVTGCVRPYVNARFKKLAGRALAVVGSYDGEFIARVKDLKDDATESKYGYATSAIGATRHCRFDVRAHCVRHAFSTNIYTRSGNLPWDSGSARENYITGECYNSTSAAWDTHGGAFDNVFENIKAYWTHQNDDDVSGTGRQYALQDRACGTIVRGLTAIGGMHGITLQGQGNEHRRDNITRLSDIYCENRSGDNARIAFDLQATTTDGDESSYRFEAHLDSATFVNFEQFNVSASAPTLHMGRAGGVALINQKWVRPGATNTIHLHNVTREHYAGSSDQAWRLASGNVIYAHRYTVLGDVAENAAFTTTTTGSSTLYVGEIQAPLTDWRRALAAGSHTMTQTRLGILELAENLPLNTWTKHTSRITRTASTPTAGTYPATPGDFGMASTAGAPWLGTSTNNTQAVEGVQIEYRIHPQYIAGGPVRVRVRAKVGTARTVKQTIDVTAQVISDAAVGSDICATAEQTLTTDYADYYFTITPATLAPGIAVKLTVVGYNDDTGGASGGSIAVPEVTVEYFT